MPKYQKNFSNVFPPNTRKTSTSSTDDTDSTTNRQMTPISESTLSTPHQQHTNPPKYEHFNQIACKSVANRKQSINKNNELVLPTNMTIKSYIISKADLESTDTSTSASSTDGASTRATGGSETSSRSNQIIRTDHESCCNERTHPHNSSYNRKISSPQSFMYSNSGFHLANENLRGSRHFTKNTYNGIMVHDQLKILTLAEPNNILQDIERLNRGKNVGIQNWLSSTEGKQWPLEKQYIPVKRDMRNNDSKLSRNIHAHKTNTF